MRTITITAVVDVAGALANDSASGHIYLMDDNKLNGSTGEGTEMLETKVRLGDRLVWTVHPLEVESGVRIARIEINRAYCEPEEREYADTGVTYWVGVIKQDLDKVVLYALTLACGGRELEMPTPASPAAGPRLVGGDAAANQQAR